MLLEYVNGYAMERTRVPYFAGNTIPIETEILMLLEDTKLSRETAALRCPAYTKDTAKLKKIAEAAACQTTQMYHHDNSLCRISIIQPKYMQRLLKKNRLDEKVRSLCNMKLEFGLLGENPLYQENI